MQLEGCWYRLEIGSGRGGVCLNVAVLFQIYVETSRASPGVAHILPNLRTCGLFSWWSMYSS